MTSVSTTMRAGAILPDGSLGLATVPRPGVTPGTVRVKVAHAALNRNDLAIIAGVGRGAGTGSATVIGADGVGVVDAVGDGVDSHLVGVRVVVLPSLHWGADEDVPGPGFELLGHPTPGTHAEWVVIPAENAFPAPDSWDSDDLAALPLAGLTAWRALRQVADVRQGEWLLVTGASGGVATMLVRFGRDLGARVLVTSSSQEGIEHAISLGAEGGALRTDETWPRRVRSITNGGVHVAVDSGGDLAPLQASLRTGGRAVSLGRTGSSRAVIDVQDLFVRHLTLHGSTMGSPRDFAAMLRHVEGVAWRPAIDSRWSLDSYADAMARLEGRHRGKIVLDIASARDS